jgi:hypothetical protein
LVVITYTQTVCFNGALTLTSAAGSDNQSICHNIPVATISYSVTGSATGASASGLPNGVTGQFAAGVFTISGTPSESGTFNYTVTTTGTPTPCVEGDATGTIIVSPMPGLANTDSTIFDASATWQIPETVTSITVEAWGGGGAGGGAELTFLGIGGGGGGGAYAVKNSIPVTPSQSMNIVVASEASGNAAGNGSDGGHSTITGFEDQIYAAGGKGGTKSVFLSPYPNGGSGGSAVDSKGDCVVSGSNGLNGFRVTAVFPVPVPSPVDGAGGAGATSNGGAGGNPVGQVVGNGNPGGAPGGGGSGSRSAVSLTFNTTGGNGAPGRVVVYYVCPEITAAGEIGGTQTICYNTAPAELSSISSAAVQTGSVEYKWQSSIVSSTDGFADFGSATGTTLTPDALTQTTWFKRMAKSKCSSTWPVEGESNVIQITVLSQFSAGEINSTGEEICSGNDAGVIGSVSEASGGNENFSYQWQSSANGTFADAMDIQGATATTYNPAALSSTTTFRRLAKDGLCNQFTSSASTWLVTVYPNSVGGNATGGTQVCAGSNSTVLTLSGETGTIQTWQYSTNGTVWTDIPASTNASYTAVDLTTDTWYRAVVKSGPCEPVNSEPTQITMNTNFKISGLAQYENNPKTPLDGLKITLKKDGIPQGSYTTGTTGYYEFTGLANGNYSIEVSTAHPGGQWQTWGGVNNTDAQLVYNHYNNIVLLPVNPPVVRIAASVKTPHPTIDNADYIAIRQVAKFGWGPAASPYFDIPKWVFSSVDPLSINNIQLNCANVSMNIRGLCAGDVNGTFVPGAGYKSALPNVELAHNGSLPLTSEIILPVRTTHDISLGAMTLFLDFDPSVMEITNITMPSDKVEKPDFRVDNGTLYIGWNSQDPLIVPENGMVFLIHARLADAVLSMSQPTPIGFQLNSNPLSELADVEGNVLDGAKLSITDAGKESVVEKWKDPESLVIYPNPAKDVLNIEFISGKADLMKMELISAQGITMMQFPETVVNEGWNRTVIDLHDVKSGAYLLKITCGDKVEMKKVIVNR